MASNIHRKANIQFVTRAIVSIPFLTVLIVSFMLFTKVMHNLDANKRAFPNTWLKRKQSPTTTTTRRGNDTCTFVIMCGNGDVDTVEEMKALIISAVLLTTCPIRFVIVTDKSTSGRVKTLFQDDLKGSMIKEVTIDIWTISTKFIGAWANSFKFSLQGHLPVKRVWLIAKLYIPFLLHNYKYLVVIDSDMVFVEDPRVLWSQFGFENDIDERQEQDQKEQAKRRTWAYKMPLNDLTNHHSICSCVVLIDVQNALKHDLYPVHFQRALERDRRKYNRTTGLFQPERVDQAVYYLLHQNRPELFMTLDQRFNVDHCHEYYLALRRSSNLRASLLHYNCEEKRFYDHPLGNVYFNFYRLYKWTWLQGEPGRYFPLKIREFDDPEASALKRYNLTLASGTS